MKICIPTDTNEGIKSRICDHFGSARFFAIYDTESKSVQVLENSNSHHVHGTCHPLSVLNDKEIDAVVCRGMGLRAVNVLKEAGIKAFKVDVSTVEEVAEKCQKSDLEAITPDSACKDHDCH